MNERIKDLKKLAIEWGFKQSEESKVPYTLIELHEKVEEKFAELIVRECIRVPYDMWDKAELNADIAVKIDHRIKEHFGVEDA
jgi:hypothetical protein